MSKHRFKSRRFISLTVAGAAGAGLLITGALNAGAANAAVPLPPKNAGFDYQIGGAYTPPSGVKIVSRDHTAEPAEGLYNICYVNAFQTQPGAEGEWDDLLLKDDNGDVVYDGKWKEAVLDTREADQRKRIAEKVNGWVDDCAAKGFDAVEPDNLRHLRPLRRIPERRRRQGALQAAGRPRPREGPGHRAEEHLRTGVRPQGTGHGLRRRRGVRPERGVRGLRVCVRRPRCRDRVRGRGAGARVFRLEGPAEHRQAGPRRPPQGPPGLRPRNLLSR